MSESASLAEQAPTSISRNLPPMLLQSNQLQLSAIQDHVVMIYQTILRVKYPLGVGGAVENPH
jgi:hypothetical protein